MCPNDAEGVANSVDWEQSDLGLHYLPRSICPKNLGSFQHGCLLDASAKNCQWHGITMAVSQVGVGQRAHAFRSMG